MVAEGELGGGGGGGCGAGVFVIFAFLFWQGTGDNILAHIAVDYRGSEGDGPEEREEVLMNCIEANAWAKKYINTLVNSWNSYIQLTEYYGHIPSLRYAQ